MDIILDALLITGGLMAGVAVLLGYLLVVVFGGVSYIDNRLPYYDDRGIWCAILWVLFTTSAPVAVILAVARNV